MCEIWSHVEAQTRADDGKRELFAELVHVGVLHTSYATAMAFGERKGTITETRSDVRDGFGTESTSDALCPSCGSCGQP